MYKKAYLLIESSHIPRTVATLSAEKMYDGANLLFFLNIKHGGVQRLSTHIIHLKQKARQTSLRIFPHT